MSGFVILIIIVGTAVGVLTLFIIKSFIAPRKIESVANLLKSGKNQQAIKAAKQLLTKEPHHVDGHYLLGQAYFAEGKTELALMEFKMVNQIGKFTGLCREVPFRKQAAELYRKFGQAEEALKEYLLLIRKEPVQADHYVAIGELFEERQMSDKALPYLQKAVELNPNHARAHLYLGILIYRKKKLLEARVELEAAVKLDPENYQAHYYLGRLLKEMHEYPTALRSLEKAQRDPEYKSKSLIEAGTCYMSMNNIDRAISTLERVINLDGNTTANELMYARYFLSLCYEKVRNIDSAIEQWEEIYARKPSFRDVAQKLSQYQELRNDDRMKDYLTSSPEEFEQICRAITTGLKLEARDVKENPLGLEIQAVEAEKNWRSGRLMPRLILFMRDNDKIDVSIVRSLSEKMKKNNISRGIVVTSSDFARKAIEFAETRPIDLVNKDQLSAVLKKVKY